MTLKDQVIFTANALENMATNLEAAKQGAYISATMREHAADLRAAAEPQPVTEWTVIAIDEATGYVTTCVQKTDEPHDAMRLTATEIYAEGEQSGIQIVCAIAGDHATIIACEDSSKAAYVESLGVYLHLKSIWGVYSPIPRAGIS